MKLENKLSQTLLRFKLVLGCGFLMLLLLTLGIFIINKGDVTLGDYGGFIGGLIGTGISFVTVILVYNTYHLQERELELQREELKETRNQLKKQQFETSFFNIMNMLKSVVNDLTLKYIHFDREVDSSIENFNGLDVFKHVSDSLKHYHYTGRSQVKKFMSKRIYSKYSDEFEFDPDETDYKILDEKIIKWINKNPSNEEFYVISLFDIINLDINGSLDPFLNTIQFLLEEFEKIENSTFYVKLIQSQLSKYQLLVLFYHGLIKSDLKYLLDQYKLLENIDDDLLINQSDVRFYPNTEFKNSYYRLRQMGRKQIQKKGV
jgi:hypothetical protein